MILTIPSNITNVTETPPIHVSSFSSSCCCLLNAFYIKTVQQACGLLCCVCCQRCLFSPSHLFFACLLFVKVFILVWPRLNKAIPSGYISHFQISPWTDSMFALQESFIFFILYIYKIYSNLISDLQVVKNFKAAVCNIWLSVAIWVWIENCLLLIFVFQP